MSCNQVTVPFSISRRIAIYALVAFVLLDLFFVVVYLVSKLDMVKSLTVRGELKFVDLDSEANLPTNYAILKLYCTALVCVLMVYWHKGKSPFFWKIAAGTLFIIGLDESAQLHELFAAGLAPILFGDILRGNQYTLIPYVALLGLFYLFSLTQFPKYSRVSFFAFVLSGFSLIASQLAELSLRVLTQYALNLMQSSDVLASIYSAETLLFAWEEGLEMFAYTLLSFGILWGVACIQRYGDPSVLRELR